MTGAEYARALKALLIQWAHKTQDAIAARLRAQVDVNGEPFEPAANFTKRYKSMRGEPSLLGVQSGDLLMQCQNRANVTKRNERSKDVQVDVTLPNQTLQKLEWFQTAAKWKPTPSQRGWYNNWVRILGGGLKQKTSKDHFYRPARVFFAPDPKIDKWLHDEIKKLRAKYHKALEKKKTIKSKRR